MTIKPTYEELEQKVKELEKEAIERKRVEEKLSLPSKIFGLLNGEREKLDIIKEILKSIKDFTGFEAVAIRLVEGLDFPYYISKGFPPEFIEAENYLCARNSNNEIILDSDGNPYLECMCGNVICGRTDPSLPFFTKGGSFWTNSTTKLLENTSEEDRQTRTRNRCHGEGYESVALIPLRSGNGVIGLLQLNDSRTDQFTLGQIQFFEDIGKSIGIAFKRKLAEEEIERYRRYLEELVEERTANLTKSNKLLQREIFKRKRVENLICAQRDLAIALSGKIELNEVLNLCLAAAIRISGLDCGGICLVDKVSVSLDLAFHKGLQAEFVNAVSHYDADSDNARLVMAGKPIYRQLRKLGILLDEALFCEELRAIAIIPVQYEGRVIACLNIASHTLEEVPDFARTALETIASQIGSTITRVKTREALKESERKYRTIFENTGTATIIIEEDMTISLANQEFEKLIGCSKEEIENKSLSKFFVKDELDKLKEYHYLRRIDPSTVPRNYETRLIDREGNVKDVYSTVAMIPGTKKSIGSILDITKLKLAEEKLQQSFAKLRKAMRGTIQVVALTVEKRDPYTAGHQRRVADLARAIATEMGLSKNQIDGTRIAGVIHDIGKISIPSEILTKPSRLSDIEFSLIKTHPQVGYEILKDVEFPWPIAQIVLQHHERMDGSGYPQGLSGEDILMEARIMAVADVVEAMSSHRPYRPALGIDTALEEISKNKGKIYDPNVVDACLKLFREGEFEFK